MATEDPEKLHQESTLVRRSFVGIALAVIGIACASVGPFLLYGISIGLLGIILGGFGYAFARHREDRLGQALGITAVVLCVIAVFISGVTGTPQ